MIFLLHIHHQHDIMLITYFLTGQPNKADDKRCDNKLEIDQAPVSRLVEATEATMETVLTDM